MTEKIGDEKPPKTELSSKIFRNQLKKTGKEEGIKNKG